MNAPLTYPDGTKSKLGDLVQVTTPRGDTSLGVIVQNGDGGVWVVPVPRSSAIFVETAITAAQANAEAVADDEAAAAANIERLQTIAADAKAEADNAAAVTMALSA